MSRFLRLALVLVPVLAIALGSAVAVGAALLTDSAPTAPAAAGSTGSTRITGGAPGGSGVAASGDECPPPCTPAAGANQGSQPVGAGYTTQHASQGSADTSQSGPSGTPAASGLGLLSSGSSGAVTPSGGSATGGACLSVLSSIPVPDLSGTGFSCAAPTSGGSGAPNAGSPAGGSGASNPGLAAAGTSGGGPGATGQSPAACQTGTTTNQSRSVASRLPAGVPGLTQFAALIVALVALGAGYALGVERRRRPLV